jgi:hypothetical protein
MILQFVIPSKNIERMKSRLASTDAKSIYSEEWCWGNVVIMENKHCGNCIYLEGVPLIELLHSFRTFIRGNQNCPKAEEYLGDENQTYSLTIAKHKNELTIKSDLCDTNCIIKGDYRKILNRFDFMIQEFFDELLYLCPELKSHGAMDMLKKAFYVKT